MFVKVGAKIKKVAKILGSVGIVISILGAILMFVAAGNSYEETMFLILGFSMLIIGTLSSLIQSLLMYGFGELVNYVDNKSRILKLEKLYNDGLITKEEKSKAILKDVD